MVRELRGNIQIHVLLPSSSKPRILLLEDADNDRGCQNEVDGIT